jgi:Holliday junction resolvasome RuvABC ATP-dependent DNA helicase subunit
MARDISCHLVAIPGTIDKTEPPKRKDAMAQAENSNYDKILKTCWFCGAQNADSLPVCPRCKMTLGIKSRCATDRPERLRDFIGQNRIKQALAGRIQNARMKGEALPHLLLGAAPEMGKRLLATVIAEELQVAFTRVHASVISRPTDLTGVLSNIHLHQVMIVEDVESLEPRVRSLLVEVLDNLRVDILVGVGPSARVHSLPMPKFTFIGLTSRLSRVDPSIRRWCVMYDFDTYTVAEIGRIIEHLAASRAIEIAPDMADELAAQCAGSPGNAVVLMERIKRNFGTSVRLEDIPAVFAELGLGEHRPKSMQLQDALNTMSGRDFELWAAGLFRRQGYVVEITEASGDHGIDLILAKDGRATAVQCKRWSDPVGEPILRDFYGAMVSAGMANGIVATTSTFTPSAKEFAHNKPIRLIDLDELLNLGAIGPETFKEN